MMRRKNSVALASALLFLSILNPSGGKASAGPAGSLDAITEKIAQHLSSYFPFREVRILKVSGGEVYLSGGPLPEGLKMRVLKESGPIEDPTTFKEIGSVLEPIGTIEVLDSYGDFAFA